LLNRHFGRAAYVVGAALILIPMFDAGTSVLPLRFAESRWRYGTIGLLSNSLLIPMAGVLVIYAIAFTHGHRRTLRALGALAALSSVLCVAAIVAIALTHGHRRTLRALGALAALSSVLCVAAIVMFALDSVQSQRDIRPELHVAYIVGSSTAAAKLLIGAIAFGFFALAGLKRLPGDTLKSPKRDQVLLGDLGARRGKHQNATV
jgi:hypothetical protein